MKDVLAAVEAAKFTAQNAHDGQTDLSGDDYMGHIKRVVSGVDGEKATIVAYLHDTVEDSRLDIGAIRWAYDDEIADAVEAITHDPSDSYDEYIADVAENELATQVKLADLEDNLDLSRLDSITSDDLDRCVTYGHAHRKLTEENQ